MRILLSFVFLLALSTIVLAQDRLHDHIYLKNGDHIQGKIISQKALDYTIIEIENGSRVKILSTEIELIISKKLRISDNDKITSFAFGIGNSYGYPGFRFQQRFGGAIGYGYHAGIGIFGMSSEEGMTLWFNGGVKFYWYKAFYLDATFGTIEKNYYSTGYKVEYGTSILLGCDYFVNPILGVNAAFGLTSNVNSAAFKIDYLAFDLGVVIRIIRYKE